MSRGWVIGTPEFRAELKEQLKQATDSRERFEMLGGDRDAHRELRAELWEERLRQLALALDVALDKLPAQKSAPPKVRLAAAMIASTSVSNGWLAKRLDMGPPASVSQYVRRFRLAGGSDRRDFKQALSRFNT
jgi:hypothetical protein